ncbi:MAG: HD domain-containing phosphohydrolase [Solirubrobacteraceae bacterium]
MTATAPTTSTRATRPRILCVDDEPQMLESLSDILYEHFDVRSAGSGAEGLAQLSSEPDQYALVISDMRMPVMSGSVFLREARRVAPDATRILLTGYSDLDAAISAVNEGQLFRFLMKPCAAEDLLAVCDAAVEQHRLRTTERELLERTLKGSIKALADVLALASPAAFGRSARVRNSVALLARALKLDDSWEVEVAALLVHIGAVTLPAETAEKLYAGANLTPGEQRMVERVPEQSRRILENIPRLEGVLEILDQYQRSYGEEGAGRSLPLGARMMRIALDHDALHAQVGDDALALAAMRARGLTYDPELLDVLEQAIGSDAHRLRVREIPLRALRAGMMLAGDVRSDTGALLIARGYTATDQLVARLFNLHAGSVRQPLMIVDDEG